jgi:hypothetical protein
MNEIDKQEGKGIRACTLALSPCTKFLAQISWSAGHGGMIESTLVSTSGQFEYIIEEVVYIGCVFSFQKTAL